MEDLPLSLKAGRKMSVWKEAPFRLTIWSNPFHRVWGHGLPPSLYEDGNSTDHVHREQWDVCGLLGDLLHVLEPTIVNSSKPIHLGTLQWQSHCFQSRLLTKDKQNLNIHPYFTSIFTWKVGFEKVGSNNVEWTDKVVLVFILSVCNQRKTGWHG